MGKAANHPAVKQLLNAEDEKLIEHLQDTGRSKRATSAPWNYATFAGRELQRSELEWIALLVLTTIEGMWVRPFNC